MWASLPLTLPSCMMGLLESVIGSSGPRDGGRRPEGWIGGTVALLVASTVGEPGPSILRTRPEQMIGSKSRMQEKVVSEPSAMPDVVVGIDVCKAWLDVHIQPSGRSLRVANTGKGSRQLIAALKGLTVRVIVIEATGKYHRGVHRTLFEIGLPVAIVHPARARKFAEALGMLAKTDKVDALMLARFGQMARLKATPPQPEALENLKEIVRSREAMIRARVALENQLETATLDCVERELRRQIRSVMQAEDTLEKAALDHVRADLALNRRRLVLVSIPGVGDATAITLIANMPELGSIDAKQAGMLAGLAPIASESGEKKGARHIRGGRGKVRSRLYMPALSAARHNPDLGRFYKRLIAAGKETKVALTAVMRKLILLANTLLKEDRMWSPNPDPAKPLHP